MLKGWGWPRSPEHLSSFASENANYQWFFSRIEGNMVDCVEVMTGHLGSNLEAIGGCF